MPSGVEPVTIRTRLPVRVLFNKTGGYSWEYINYHGLVTIGLHTAGLKYRNCAF